MSAGSDSAIEGASMSRSCDPLLCLRAVLAIHFCHARMAKERETSTEGTREGRGKGERGPETHTTNTHDDRRTQTPTLTAATSAAEARIALEAILRLYVKCEV